MERMLKCQTDAGRKAERLVLFLGAMGRRMRGLTRRLAFWAPKKFPSGIAGRRMPR